MTDATELDYYKDLFGGDGGEELFDYFSKIKKEKIGIEDLQKYFNEKDPANFTSLDDTLEELFGALASDDPDERTTARKELSIIAGYMEDRGRVLQEAREGRKDLMPKYADMPPVTGAVWNNIGRPFKAYYKALMDKQTPGKEKAVMIAGAIAMIYVAKMGLDVVKEKQPGLLKFLGFGLGAGVIYMGAETAYRTVHRMNYPDKKAWEESSIDLEDVHEGMQKKTKVPKSFLDRIQGTEMKYSLAIANLTNLTASQFQELYMKNFRDKTIPNNAPGYLRKPFQSDRLDPTDRFIVMEQMADALGFGAAGDELEIEDDQKDLTILYLAMRDFA